ncbi:hypothetical protein L218DRAFT_522743 [Marasmius fiardii PR-910]|nr:hypothetical protein L218DRAFT_522743 [Marasmius fiardii PR-910]
MKWLFIVCNGLQRPSEAQILQVFPSTLVSEIQPHHSSPSITHRQSYRRPRFSSSQYSSAYIPILFQFPVILEPRRGLGDTGLVHQCRCQVLFALMSECSTFNSATVDLIHISGHLVITTYRLSVVPFTSFAR